MTITDDICKRLADSLQPFMLGLKGDRDEIAHALADAGVREAVEAIGECDHQIDEERHAFEWDDVPHREIWNPYAPRCSKCGHNIGAIIKSLGSTLTALRGQEGPA